MNEVTDDSLREIYTAIVLWQLVPSIVNFTDPTQTLTVPALAVGIANEVVKELNKAKARTL